jgi:hypothetical protein
MPAGLGQTTLGFYSVPAGKTAYIERVRVNVVSSKEADLRLFVREGADVVSAPFTAPRLKSEWDGISEAQEVTYHAYKPAPAKSDIYFEAIATGGASTAVDVSFDIILVDD